MDANKPLFIAYFADYVAGIAKELKKLFRAVVRFNGTEIDFPFILTLHLHKRVYFYKNIKLMTGYFGDFFFIRKKVLVKPQKQETKLRLR